MLKIILWTHPRPTIRGAGAAGAAAPPLPLLHGAVQGQKNALLRC